MAQRLIGHLGLQFGRRGKSRGAIALAAPAGDLHTLPVAIVADLLRWRAFEVLELGGNTPAEALAEAVARAGSACWRSGIVSTTRWSGGRSGGVGAVGAGRGARCRHLPRRPGHRSDAHALELGGRPLDRPRAQRAPWRRSSSIARSMRERAHQQCRLTQADHPTRDRPWPQGLDGLLEATVVGSFSRLGFALRSRMEGWTAPASPRRQGHRRDRRLVGHRPGGGPRPGTTRSRSRAGRTRRSAAGGHPAIGHGRSTAAGRIDTAPLDLVDPDAVRGFADALGGIRGSSGRARPLCRRAVRGLPDGGRRHRADLGHARSRPVPPQLACSRPSCGGRPPSVIVTVSSGGMYTQRFDLARLEISADGYRGATAYARAKRAQVVLAHEWARRWGPDGVASYAMHPGWVDTPGLATGLPRFARLGPLLRTPDQGADTVVWLAADGPRHDGSAPHRVPGGIWLDRRRRCEYYLPTTYRTPAQRRRDGEALWQWCAGRLDTGAPLSDAMTSRAVVWFRRDLRLEDNPAWAAATARADRVTALYVLDPVLLEGRRRIPADTALGTSRRARRDPAPASAGASSCARGTPTTLVPAIAESLGAELLCANADVTPYARRRDRRRRRTVRRRVRAMVGQSGPPPGFAPRRRRVGSRGSSPLSPPSGSRRRPAWPRSGPAVRRRRSGRRRSRARGPPLPTRRRGGGVATRARTSSTGRRVPTAPGTFPAVDGTSLLSADLRFGVLAPAPCRRRSVPSTTGRASFVRQLAWRDWYAHLLWEEPSLVDTALRPEFDGVAWENDPGRHHGLAGRPHRLSRSSMPACASWRRPVGCTTASAWSPPPSSSRTFWSTGASASAGSGGSWSMRTSPRTQATGNGSPAPDPMPLPYFRVFNPVVQSRKFDPGRGVHPGVRP